MVTQKGAKNFFLKMANAREITLIDRQIGRLVKPFSINVYMLQLSIKLKKTIFNFILFYPFQDFFN